MLASIPSPAQSIWYLGPLPLRAYALAIIVGIFVAIAWGSRRWAAAGHRAEDVADIAMWAVPFGIIGGRVYHVLTDWQMYFGAGGSGLVGAVQIWRGGLGIWGAITLGFLGAWIGARRAGITDFPGFADALAPGIVTAQAIGRIGNWFNQELFGRPTDLPWGLEIAPAHRPAGYTGFATFHPTFLYEALGALAIPALLVWAQRRFALANGRVFALYVAAYCAVRFFVEGLRIDTAHAFWGLRLNEYTALIVGAAALVVLRRRRPVVR